MKSDAEMFQEVAGIDECINRTREKMAKTDETINALLKLNSNRRDLASHDPSCRRMSLT